MKILFLTHKFHPDIGGIEVNSEVLAGEFMKAGHEVCLVTWSPGPATRSFPYKVVRQPSVAELFKLHRWADVVFENNPCLRLSWPNVFIKRRRAVAIRTQIRRNTGKIAWQDKLKIWWLHKADGAVAVSESIRVNFWPKATVIGNPFRHNDFKNLQATDRKGFVYFGRLVPQKRVDTALEAIKILSEKHPQKSISFTVIGDGSERENLEVITERLQLKSRVTFTGALQGPELVNELNRHKYLLIPSFDEAFGNVAIEGLACGLLPFVADSGGLPDAVGKAGIVFTYGNAEALAAAIEHILHNPEVENQYRQQAAEHLKNHYPEKVAARYLEIITGESAKI